MSWFNNMKIKTKMAFCFTIVIVLLVFIGGFAIFQMQEIGGNYETAIDHPLAARQTWMEIRGTFRDQRRVITAMSIYMEKDASMVETCYQDAVKDHELTLEFLAQYDELVKTNPRYKNNPKEIETKLQKSDDIRALINRYWDESAVPMYEAAQQNDDDAFYELALHTGEVTEALRKAIDEMITISESTADETVDDANSTRRTSTVMIIVVAVVAVVIGIFVAMFLSNYISRLLVAMSAFFKKVGTTGNISINTEVQQVIGKYGDNKDELGELTTGAVGFINHVTNISKELETVAGGDLRNDINPISSNDVMGNSLKKVVDNLSGMFVKISGSSAQVTTGSSQISDGAQTLASGSTEQAATLEELSASVSDIAQKTKENAERTNNAADLAANIMSNAEKGTKQMEDMINAVNKINEANKNISNVIKAIDDIAFQTNILALNASVEAARAGAAGKGFAVVAEEVRSLAGKSAESAKDTSELIANSIEKAQLGTQIAGETSASLADIVSGIGESNRIIADIARSSEEQSEAIAQINIGINGVTQVVQQNSATAEQSAAASEEMSSQAQTLEDLVNQFKLKQ